jgi:hypothetical protein
MLFLRLAGEIFQLFDAHPGLGTLALFGAGKLRAHKASLTFAFGRHQYFLNFLPRTLRGFLTFIIFISVHTLLPLV